MRWSNRPALAAFGADRGDPTRFLWGGASLQPTSTPESMTKNSLEPQESTISLRRCLDIDHREFTQVNIVSQVTPLIRQPWRTGASQSSAVSSNLL